MKRDAVSGLLLQVEETWVRTSIPTKILVAMSILLTISWLWVGAYQTHYLSALRLMGDEATQNLFGTPKEGRGDEWSTYLPVLKQAYLEGFPARSDLAPYFESYKLFVGVPIFSWTLIFTPCLALYFVVPGPLALSFQGLFYNALFLLSFVWLLRNLGVRRNVAVPVALTVLFSMYYQVWWTSNFSTLGPSLLPLAVLSSSIRWRYRFFLLTWSIAHMLMGAMYPPFYYVVAASVVPIIVAVKPELRKPLPLLLAAASAAIAVLLYWSHYSEYVEAVSLTTYPGTRFSTGGGAPWSVLLGLVFPTAPAPTQTDAGLTIYELCVVGTMLPAVCLMAFLRTEWSKEAVSLLCVFVTMFVVMSLFIVVGNFPQAVAKYTGLFVVPGRRMQLGVSLSTVLVSAIFISKAYGRIENRHMLLAAAAFTLGSLFFGVRPDAKGQFFMIDAYPWLFLALAVIGSGWDVLRSDQRAFARGARALPFVLWGGALAHVVIFGSFNPIMRSKDILKPVQTQLTEDWKALFAANGDSPIATIGNYGHLLRGENLQALEAIHLVNVTDEDYRRTFPELNGSDRERLFNQMRGIRFDNIGRYDASGLTAVLPVMQHAYTITPEVRRIQGSELEDLEPLNDAVSVGESARINLSDFKVFWKSQLNQPLALGAPLAVSSECAIKSAQITRYPIDITAYTGRIMLRGLAGAVVVLAKSEESAAACISGLRVTSSAVVAGSAERFVSMPRRTLEAAAWSGRACDLSGDADRSLQPGRTAGFDGYLIGSRNGVVPKFSFVLRNKAAAAFYRAEVRTGAIRKDVAEYFKAPKLAQSGFRIRLSFDGVPQGRYDVVFLFFENGSGFFCESGKSVAVR